SQCVRARPGPPAPLPFPWFPFAPRFLRPARLPPRFLPVCRNRRDDAALSPRLHRSSWSASFFPFREFGQPVQDLVSLDFQLPCQLIDSNLLHRESYLLLP